MRRILICFLTVSGFVFLAQEKSFAADSDSMHTEQWRIRQKTYYISETRVHAQEGNFDMSMASLSLKKSFPVCGHLPLDFGLTLEHYSVNDGTGVHFPSSLQSKVMSLGVRFPVPGSNHERMFVGIDCMPSFYTAGEHGLYSAAFRLHYATMFIYKKDDSFIVITGILFRPEFETQTVAFMGIRCRITDRVWINFLSREPNIAYVLNEKTRLLVELSTDDNEFEVTQGPRKGEIVSIHDLRLGLGLLHNFSRDIKAKAQIGWSFDRNYRYVNGKGKVVPDNTLYVGYSVNVAF